MRPHNLPLTVVGASLVWFGWFGFNAGSSLAANGLAALAFVNTNTAAAAAALAWMFLDWKLTGKPTLLGGISGVFAGLVAITPAAGYVSPLSAICIGAVAAVGCYFAVSYFKNRLGYDDSLDAFGVHGVGGTIGAAATGIFADQLVNPNGSNGLLFGNPMQFLIQLIAITCVILYVIIASKILIKIVDWVVGVRVTANDELLGLDIAQHKESAYTLID